MATAEQEQVWATMMWRRVDTPGHDVCRLIRRGVRWALEGTAMFLHRATPCALAYRIDCDARFRTNSARIEGWLGRQRITLNIRANAHRQWRMNGRPVPAVKGCIDVDINVSPSTNLLSLRRLCPGIGETIQVRAAWLKFPELKLLPLEQTYRRIGAHTYDYRAPSVRFATHLVADRRGFVVEYPPLWTRESR